MGRRTALLVVATHRSVLLDGEWLEEFWCDQCDEARWYHVRRLGDRAYDAAVAPFVSGNRQLRSFTPEAILLWATLPDDRPA
jgi:hypothetical protein